MLIGGTRAWCVLLGGAFGGMAAASCGNAVELVDSGASSSASGTGGTSVSTSVTVGTTATTTTATASATTSTGVGGGGSNDPPAPPANGAMGDGPGYVYAVSKLYIGDTDWNGS